MTESDKKLLLMSRRESIVQWLEENAPYAAADQLHLNAGSTEQAYWHLGYATAMADVIRLLEQLPSVQER